MSRTTIREIIDRYCEETHIHSSGDFGYDEVRELMRRMKFFTLCEISEHIGNKNYWEINVPEKTQMICAIDGDEIQKDMESFKKELEVEE